MSNKLVSFDDVLCTAQAQALEVETLEESKELIDSLVFAARSDILANLASHIDMFAQVSEDDKLTFDAINTILNDYKEKITEEINALYPSDS